MKKIFNYKLEGNNHCVKSLRVKFKLGKVQQKSFKINSVIQSSFKVKEELEAETPGNFITFSKYKARLMEWKTKHYRYKLPGPLAKFPNIPKSQL